MSTLACHAPRDVVQVTALRLFLPKMISNCTYAHEKLQSFVSFHRHKIVIKNICIPLFQAQASYSDGSPGANTHVKLTVTMNNGAVSLFDGFITTNGDGLVTKTVKVPSNANCLKIMV